MSLILRDYQHARRAFNLNYGTLADRLPKQKFLFHVYIDLNTDLLNDVKDRKIDEKILSIFVKSCELPKLSVETKKLNAYNRFNIVQTKAKYDPVQIRFHDDGTNHVRNLWEKYFQFFFLDNRIGTNQGAPHSSFNETYKYRDALPVPFGYQPKKDLGSMVNVIKAIRIYSLHGKNYTLYVLVNPIITSFSPSGHDYSESDNIEYAMSVEYETVLYDQGVSIDDIKGFTEVGYDKTEDIYPPPVSSQTDREHRPPVSKNSLGNFFDRSEGPEPTDDFEFGPPVDTSVNGLDIQDPRSQDSVSEDFQGLDGPEKNNYPDNPYIPDITQAEKQNIVTDRESVPIKYNGETIGQVTSDGTIVAEPGKESQLQQIQSTAKTQANFLVNSNDPKTVQTAMIDLQQQRRQLLQRQEQLRNPDAQTLEQIKTWSPARLNNTLNNINSDLAVNRAFLDRGQQQLKNIMASDTLSTKSGTGQQSLREDRTKKFNFDILNKDMGQLSEQRKLSVSQIINNTETVSILQSKRQSISSLPESNNRNQVLRQIDTEITNKEKNIVLYQNQIGYFDSEISRVNQQLDNFQ